jgi:hypothetical protein
MNKSSVRTFYRKTAVIPRGDWPSFPAARKASRQSPFRTTRLPAGPMNAFRTWRLWVTFAVPGFGWPLLLYGTGIAIPNEIALTVWRIYWTTLLLWLAYVAWFQLRK